MIHAKQIQQIVDDGKVVEAHDALDNLLSLGPSNLEALKLRAQLFEYEGRFNAEMEIWDKILTIDDEDPDAIAYLYRRQVEDREYFYFTDDVPEGGRTFLAHPRSLFNAAFIGLIGCISFMLLAQVAEKYAFANKDVVILGGFAVMVILPWISIIFTWVRSLKYLKVSLSGIEVASRIKRFTYKWKEIDKIYLARNSIVNDPELSLLLVPKDRTLPWTEIDFNYRSSPIRARSYLLKEIKSQFDRLEYGNRDSIVKEGQEVVSF